MVHIKECPGMNGDGSADDVGPKGFFMRPMIQDSRLGFYDIYDGDGLEPL